MKIIFRFPKLVVRSISEIYFEYYEEIEKTHVRRESNARKVNSLTQNNMFDTEFCNDVWLLNKKFGDKIPMKT